MCLAQDRGGLVKMWPQKCCGLLVYYIDLHLQYIVNLANCPNSIKRFSRRSNQMWSSVFVCVPDLRWPGVLGTLPRDRRGSRGFNGDRDSFWDSLGTYPGKSGLPGADGGLVQSVISFRLHPHRLKEKKFSNISDRTWIKQACELEKSTTFLNVHILDGFYLGIGSTA